MESQTVEHKKTFGKEVIISLVAFANAEGGKVIVGVDDLGIPCGVENGPETVQRHLNEIKVSTYPQIIPKVLIEQREGKQVLVFEISEFPVKPVSYKNRYYKRASDIVIKIFDDRIVFTNPGRLYGKLRVADLERNDYVSSLRNRLLAEAFYLTGDIERYGTGFVRIREFLQAYPEVTLLIEEIGDFFKVELRITPPITPPGKHTDYRS